jgi:hypothetical protein
MGVIVPNPTVTEVDGSPVVKNVQEIKFSNGTVTASGRTATIVNDGGGSGVESVSGTTPVSSTGGTTPTISLDDLGITEGKIAASAVTSDKVAASAIVAGKIATNAVETAKINALAVTTAKLAASAVSSAKLADDSVATAKIVDLNVTEGKLAADAVATAKIADSAVTTAKVAATAITQAKIANDAIGAAQIIDDAVTNDAVAANAIKTVNIEDSSVTVAKISATGTPSASTYLTGAGTWAAASGGDNDFDVKLVSVTLDGDTAYSYAAFPIMMMAPYGSSNHATANIDGKIAFFPFIAPKTGDIDKMYGKVTTAAGSACDVYVGVYSNGTGNVPGTRQGYVTIDGTVSGAWSTSTFSDTIAVTAGTQYWLALGKSANVTVKMSGCRAQYAPSVAPQQTIRESYPSQSIVTNNATYSFPASVTADDLEPGFSFSDLMNAPNVGVEIS